MAEVWMVVVAELLVHRDAAHQSIISDKFSSMSWLLHRFLGIFKVFQLTITTFLDQWFSYSYLFNHLLLKTIFQFHLSSLFLTLGALLSQNFNVVSLLRIVDKTCFIFFKNVVTSGILFILTKCTQIVIKHFTFDLPIGSERWICWWNFISVYQSLVLSQSCYSLQLRQFWILSKYEIGQII